MKATIEIKKELLTDLVVWPSCVISNKAISFGWLRYAIIIEVK